MPIGEDDCDLDYSSSQSGMSKAEQRKSNKPIMEKRRRARINHCLNELKSLILEAMKKDPARHSKLEKADILEMTVKHLHTIQRQQLNNAIVVDPQVLQKFKTGFSECAGEVSRYISRLDGVEPAVRHRLVAHLSNCVSGLQVAPVSVNLGNGLGVTQVVHTTPMMPQVTTPNSGDINNNSNVNNRVQVPAGLQLIPSRLPSGELALVLPNGQLPAGVLPFIAQPESIVTATSVPSVPQGPVPTHPQGPHPQGPLPQGAPPAPCAPPIANRTIDRSKGSAFTAVGRSASPECLSSSSLEEEESTTTTDTFTSPDTPPTSARALHQTRVAAEVKKELVYPPSPASSSSETRSLAELKLEVRAVDFSLKRERPSGSDDVPAAKVPRIAVPQPQPALPRAHSSRQPSLDSHSSEETRGDMWRPW